MTHFVRSVLVKGKSVKPSSEEYICPLFLFASKQVLEMSHKHRQKTWLHSLFECRNLHKYACAMVFPCVPMNTVRRLLNKEHENNDVESSAAAVISAAPLVVGAMSFNQSFEQQAALCCHGSDEDAEEELNPMLKTAACLIYPCLICPTTCILRSYAIDHVKIVESCPQTTLISMLCWPCALVQIEDELHGQGYAMAHVRRDLS